MFKKDLNYFVSELIKDFKHANIELYYNNDFQLLIAILMSAQSRDIQINKVNKDFFKLLITPEDGINLWIDKIKEYIKSISFFNNKATNIYKNCLILKDKKLEEFNTISKLTKLHWVWIKTAKVFLSVTKGENYIAVDTHVHRISNRLWLVNTKTPLETDKALEKLIKINNLSNIHHQMVFFWRYNCTAKKAKCNDCKFYNICKYYKSKLI